MIDPGTMQSVIGNEMVRPLKRLFLALPLLLVGCLSGNADDPDSGTVPPPPPSATLPWIQENIFSVHCTGCHGSNGGLTLTDGQSYGELTGIDSVAMPGTARVEPGDPDNSYLIWKLEGDPRISGDQMPSPGSPLPVEDITLIRQWITDGALNGKPITADVSTPRSFPADGDVLGDWPAAIQIDFHQDIDGSTLSDYSVQMIASGGDCSFGEGNETRLEPLRMDMDGASTTRLLVDLTRFSPLSDCYRLILRGSGEDRVQTLFGETIDGNGDGKPGDDYVLEFEVME